KGGDGDDLIHGTGEAAHSPGFGTPPETTYGGDSLYGQAGNDHLIGDLGGDFLAGGGGHDILAGGPHPNEAPPPPADSLAAHPGNDLILAADHDKDNRIDCGPGKHDVAVIDKIDPRPAHCEKVRVKG